MTPDQRSTRCDVVIRGYRCAWPVHEGKQHQPSLFTEAEERATFGDAAFDQATWPDTSAAADRESARGT